MKSDVLIIRIAFVGFLAVLAYLINPLERTQRFGQDVTDLWDGDDICLENFTQSLHRDVRSIRNSRGTPKHVNVYGYLYDIQTQELHLVEENPGDPAAPRGPAWR